MGPVLLFFCPTLTHPSKTVSSSTDAPAHGTVCVSGRNIGVKRRRDHFIRKILLTMNTLVPKLWAGWL